MNEWTKAKNKSVQRDLNYRSEFEKYNQQISITLNVRQTNFKT